MSSNLLQISRQNCICIFYNRKKQVIRMPLFLLCFILAALFSVANFGIIKGLASLIIRGNAPVFC